MNKAFGRRTRIFISRQACSRLMTLLPAVLLSALSVIPVFANSTNLSVQARSIAATFRLPDTPFLPPYCGRIVSGDVLSTPLADGGIAYSITFEAAEQPNQVITWYKSALQMYGWNFSQEESGQYRLRAQHGHNIVSDIYLLSPRKSGACTQVQLYYRYVGHEI